jgi:hypothetical protein
MSAGTITITAGRPNRQGEERDFSGPDGTYPVTLVAVSEEVTEPSSLADAKGDGTWTYRVWTFAIDGGECDGQVIDMRANARSAGPTSKQFGLVAAFVGRTPPVGAQVDIQRHLVGRQALASIVTSDNGFPKVDKVLALPAQRNGSAPAPTPAPAPPAAAPVASPPEPATAPVASPDSLPF